MKEVRHALCEPGRRGPAPRREYAADAFEGRLIAVVLTGLDSDGTDGVQSVKAHGGLVIAQDQATSLAFGMPGSAIATGCVDRVLPLGEIGPALRRLVETG